MEWVAGITGMVSGFTGIGGRHGPEWVAGFAWNTHPKAPEGPALVSFCDPGPGAPESQVREIPDPDANTQVSSHPPGQEERTPEIPEGGSSLDPLSDESGAVDGGSRDRAPLKLHYKFIADLEADAWAVLEEALRVASKQSGKRDRAYLLRHLAEFFLHETRVRKEERGVAVPQAPFRVVIHDAPLSGVSWVERVDKDLDFPSPCGRG